MPTYNYFLTLFSIILLICITVYNQRATNEGAVIALEDLSEPLVTDRPVGKTGVTPSSISGLLPVNYLNQKRLVGGPDMIVILTGTAHHETDASDYSRGDV